MKFIQAFTVALILSVSVNAVNNNLLKEAQSNQLQSNGLSFFSRLFGNAKSQKKQREKDLNARAIFKGLQALNQLRQNSGSPFLRSQDRDKQRDDQLPYEALLPRRRIPLDLKLQNAQKILQQSEQNQGSNPISELITQLTKQKIEDVNQDFNWQNPVFKDKQNGEQIPFFNIFGKRRFGKNSNRLIITDAEIQSLLIQKVPSFQGGKIIKMTTNHYKKGLFLNIEFQDKQNKMFSIIARYRPRKHLLQIVSVKSNAQLGKIDQKPLLQESKSANTFQNKIKQSNNKQQGVKALEQKLKAMQELNKMLQSKITETEKVENKKEQIKVKPTENSASLSSDHKQQTKHVQQKKTQVENTKVEKPLQIEISKQPLQPDQQKNKEQPLKTLDQATQKNILNQ